MLGWSAMAAHSEEEKPGWFRRNFCTLTWDEIQTVVKTPRSISSAVRTHIRYADDQPDNWATGKEAWEKKQGDCKSYAACVIDLCKAAGIQAEIKIFFPRGSGEGHAVVVGSLKGQLWISSNGWYQTVTSMDDAKRTIAREAGWRHREILVASAEDVKSGSLVLAVASR